MTTPRCNVPTDEWICSQVAEAESEFALELPCLEIQQEVAVGKSLVCSIPALDENLSVHASRMLNDAAQ